MSKLNYSAQPDGSSDVYDGGRCIGRLMPPVNQATIEASPGIQSWSSPRGKTCSELYDPQSVASFAAHWERKWRKTYPLDFEAQCRELFGRIGNKEVTS